MQGFRNHTVLQLELTQPRLLVIGPNGIGKSNLLEAVELLGSLRSHRCSNDRDLIQWDTPQALIRADVGDGDRLELELRRQGGRQARRNGKLLDRQLDLIGPLRCAASASAPSILIWCEVNPPYAASGWTGWCCSLSRCMPI